MNALALNAGSTSLKFGLFALPAREPVLSGEIEWSAGDRLKSRLTCRTADGYTRTSLVAAPDDPAAASHVFEQIRAFGGKDIVAVGHRVVHGGADCAKSLAIDTRVKAAISHSARLAPLHNPPALRIIEAAEAALPSALQVAVFDTAFFSELPLQARLYGLPYDWFTRYGLARQGFHGISHGYCAERVSDLCASRVPGLRLVNCHLGGGCSAAAIRDGKAVATTMGFSPLEGLVMGTRPGSVDPGILIYLLREKLLSLDQIEHALNYESGLLGLSGIAADLAPIEAAMAEGSERARLAFEVFVDRLRSAVAALASSLGGIDCLAFTDRIGERSWRLRAAVCAGLQFMGVAIDEAANRSAIPDSDIATPDAKVRVFVLRTREEYVVACEAARVAGKTWTRKISH